MLGRGMNLQSEVRTKIAAQRSGSDETILICDGVETFYSGDGRSYYKGDARVTPQCDLPLSKFYELDNSPASFSMIGRDRARFADVDLPCLVVRAEWMEGTVNVVGTMCIDLARPLILRDVIESQDETGIRSVKTTTFRDFESNPTFPPDAFRFSIPPSAVEAKPRN